MKTKFNLTTGQRLALPFIWLFWKMSPNAQPTFSLVKSAMEKHEHNYNRLQQIKGTYVLRCEHPGCNMVEPLDDTFTHELAGRLDWVNAEITTRARCIIENAQFPDRVENFKRELDYFEATKMEMLETIKKYLATNGTIN